MHTDVFKTAASHTRRWIGLAALFSVFVNLLTLATPIYMMQVFDRVLSSGSVETLVALTGIVLAAVAVYGVLDGVRGRILASTGANLERRLSPSLVTAAVHRQMGGRPVGTEPLQDLARVRSFLGAQGVVALMDAPWVPVMVAAMFLLHRWLGVLALVGALVLFALAVANEFVARRPAREAAQHQKLASRRASDAARNADAVLGMGMLEGLLARWGAEQGRSISAQDVGALRGGVIGSAAKFVRMALQVGVLAVGAYWVLQGQLTGGAMIAGSILLGRALQPVEQSISGWRGCVAARQSWGAIRELFAGAAEGAAPLSLPEPQGKVTVEGLGLAAPTGAQVLRAIRLSLEPGASLALVGPSGAGKSALCKAIVGSWAPTAGAVRLDGAEIRHWPEGQRARHVGYLPQDIELFAGTIAENIARFTDTDDAEIVSAARLAGAHDVILALPDGYQTRIGPGGVVLSGGQRQRIGLARALFGDPKLVVLDEPSASLDDAGDQALQEALARLREACVTVVIVSHRPSDLRSVEKVAVLKDGQLLEVGPRDEVLKKILGPRASAA